MKRLLLILLVVTAFSGCSLKDDDYLEFQVEFLPIERVEFPDEIYTNQVNKIKIYYRRPNDCYYYDGVYVEKDETSQTLAIQCLVVQDANCKPIENENPEMTLYDFSFSGHVDAMSTYTLKIFKGKDEAGNMIFETITVPQ